MKPKNYLNELSAAIVGGFERFFFWYGNLVATHKWRFLLGSLIVCGLCCIGFLNFTTENNPYKCYVPKGSDSVENNKWIIDNYPSDLRYNNFLITGEDVLEPEVLKEMLRMHNEVKNDIVLDDGSTWAEICKKLPIPSFPIPESMKEKEFKSSDCPSYDPSVCMESDAYCKLFNETLSPVCFERSILELWGYEEEIYVTLTKEDIMAKVNEPNVTSQIFKFPFPMDSYLSYTTDDSGRIIGASGVSMTWMGHINRSNIEIPDSLFEAGLPVDPNSLEFEDDLLEVMFSYQDSFNEVGSGYTCYANVDKASDDIVAESLISDAYFVPVAFFLVFAYVMVILGNYHWVETRAMLALSGCVAVALSIFVCFGICSMFGLMYTAMHNGIPFILLGIGIDDMFVIIQCYDNLKKEEIVLGNHPYNIALAMRHAGSAITVTSLTDFIVFSIGATSALPALSSFCLYCAVGIVTVFVLQATFFVACLSFDLERVEHGRNGCLLCYKHKEYVYEYKEANGISKKMFRYAGKLFMQLPVKIFLILSTLAFLGIGIWGCVSLEVRFDYVWFLPKGSFLRDWYDVQDTYYPSEGETGLIYMTDLNYPEELFKIENLINNMTMAAGNIRAVTSWYPEYKEYINEHIGLGDNGPGIPEEILPMKTFIEYTSRFLFSPMGSKWQPAFHPTDDQLSCGVPIKPLALTTFVYTHVNLVDTHEQINALNELKSIIKKQDFSSNVFPACVEYGNWETNEVIKYELFRNLGISLVCIFVTTLLLLANLRGSLLVMLCVCMVLVDVLGFMHFWGLTIDVVTSTCVIISVGLCVDYSAHIAHTFLGKRGSRSDRAAETLTDIGTAVLNGGFSTFIATVTLCASDSYIFVVFFRTFFLVVLFGLFHGLVFLPIMFSLVGPRTYEFKREVEEDTEKIVMKVTEDKF